MFTEKHRPWIVTVLFGGFALPRIWVRTLAVTGLSVVVTFLYEQVPAFHHAVTATPFSLIGLPLGIFLGFRNNASYDRFWEGRRLWGSLVNTSRSLARQALTLLTGPEEASALAKKLVHFVIAFAHALRHHLRESSPFEHLEELVGAEETARLRGQDNVPYAILQRLGELVAEARQKGFVDPFHVPVLEGSLTALTDIQGACERIKTTPLPYSYTVLMHRIVAVYCVTLPFGLMDAIHRATPFVVLAISYCFFGLDAIGDELEQPFGTDVNDLPIAAISRTIERNLRQRLGEPLPPALAPIRGILN